MRTYHGTRVLFFQLFDILHVLFIGHFVTKDFLSVNLDLGIRRVSTATIGLYRDFLSSLCLDGEFDLIKIGEVLGVRIVVVPRVRLGE